MTNVIKCLVSKDIMLKDKKKTRKKKKASTKVPSLVNEILSDVIFKHWFVATLGILLVGSAMLQAKTSHEVRITVALHENLKDESHEKQVKLQLLRLELSGLTEPNRISEQARKKLGMIAVTSKNENIIRLQQK